MAGIQERQEVEVDETQVIIAEFRQKIAEALQRENFALRKLAEREASHIIEGAWAKAEGIIAKATGEAEHVVDEARQKASEEANTIISQARQRAELLLQEAEAHTRAKAKERVRREEERILRKAREEAETIIARARKTAEKESGKIIAASRKEAKQVVQSAKDKARAEIAEGRLFEGDVELQIASPFTDSTQIRSFKECLAKVIHIKATGESLSSDGDCSLYITIDEPIPLPYILKKMPPVDSVVVQDKRIRLTLKNEPDAAAAWSGHTTAPVITGYD